MTPTEDMFLPENAEKLRLLMEKYDKMAEDAIEADKELTRLLEEQMEKAKNRNK